MMRNLCLDEGQLLQVESASLPVATYSKFQPQSTDFLDITNPKAVYPFSLNDKTNISLSPAYFVIEGMYSAIQLPGTLVSGSNVMYDKVVSTAK